MVFKDGAGYVLRVLERPYFYMWRRGGAYAGWAASGAEEKEGEEGGREGGREPS